MARWETARERRLEVGPWRSEWPVLAAGLVSYGRENTRDVAIGGGPPAASAVPPVTLSELESLALLRAAGLPVVDAVAVADPEAAVAAARRMGGSVVLKLDATGLAHKSDTGGVALGLRGDEAVHDAATSLFDLGLRLGLPVRGLLVEPMVGTGVELIVGLRRDPQFGPVVLVGFGGTQTEVLDDVAIRLAPLRLDAALQMLDDLRGARLLDGVRGRPPVDRAAVASMLVSLGQLGIDRPDLIEVDLNPVIASAGGALAVDALVVLERSDDDR